MTPAETAAILRQFIDWRRDTSNWPPSPMLIEKAIDAAIEMIERLEAAEKSDAESIAMYLKARDERDALRAELTDLRNSMTFRTSLIGRIEAEREDLHALIAAVKKQVNAEFRLRMKKEIECNALRAKIEAMQNQEPYQYIYEYANPIDGSPVWRDTPGYWNAQFPRSSKPLYLAPGAQPAPSVPECPYPCGWRNLFKHAIEDGAYLARSINEDEPVTENARAVTMRTVMRLRDVLLAINNAAPEAKP